LVRQLEGKPETMPGSFVEESLRGSVTDLLLRVRLKGRRRVYVYCLIEHKRTDAPEVMLQLLRYLSALYDELARQHGPRLLPLVIPLVVYNGGRPWRGPRRFSDLLERRSSRLGLDFGMVLLDLNSTPAQQLSSHRALLGGLLSLKVASSRPELQRPLVLRSMEALSTQPSTKRLFVRYLLRVADQKTHRLLNQTLREAMQGKDDVVPTIAQYLQKKGYQRGKRQGIKLGREEGREEGREATLRQALRRVLISRFKKLTPTHDALLAEADLPALEAWFDRALEARSLRALFQTH
jgi:predicted transposase/invertase (TIGR01784 family)